MRSIWRVIFQAEEFGEWKVCGGIREHPSEPNAELKSGGRTAEHPSGPSAERTCPISPRGETVVTRPALQREGCSLGPPRNLNKTLTLFSAAYIRTTVIYTTLILIFIIPDRPEDSGCHDRLAILTCKIPRFIRI